MKMKSREIMKKVKELESGRSFPRTWTADYIWKVRRPKETTCHFSSFNIGQQQASWAFSSFCIIITCVSLSRSPALKPLWLALGGSDAEALYSGLFRKFFCHGSKDYFVALDIAKKTHRQVVPAYLLHIKDLALGLGQHRNSSLIIMETQLPDLVESPPKVKVPAWSS